VRTKKRAVVFYNESGGAHVSAARVIKETLNDYDITLVNFAKEFLNKVNWMAKATNYSFGSDELYNFAMRNGMFKIINFVGKHFAYDLVGGNLQPLSTLLEDYLRGAPFDLVISTIPLVNSAILEATRAVNLPFVVVTLDGDMRYWKVGLKPKADDRFAITVTINCEEARKELTDAGFYPSHIHATGFPIRKSFFQAFDQSALTRDFKVGPESAVVMLLMGGEGSKRIVKLVRKLATHHRDLHLFVCIGKNDALREAIQAIETTANVKITIVGFTQRIPELMALSNVIITKSGPSTIAEALQLKLPMIIDQSGATLDHESKHAGFVSTNNLGLVLNRKRELPELVEQLITDNAVSRTIKSSLVAFHAQSFQETFPALVASLGGCENSEASHQTQAG